MWSGVPPDRDGDVKDGGLYILYCRTTDTQGIRPRRHWRGSGPGDTQRVRTRRHLGGPAQETLSSSRLGPRVVVVLERCRTSASTVSVLVRHPDTAVPSRTRPGTQGTSTTTKGSGRFYWTWVDRHVCRSQATVCEGPTDPKVGTGRDSKTHHSLEHQPWTT